GAPRRLTFETRTTRKSGWFCRVYLSRRCETARPAKEAPTTTTVLAMSAAVNMPLYPADVPDNHPGVGQEDNGPICSEHRNQEQVWEDTAINASRTWERATEAI